LRPGAGDVHAVREACGRLYHLWRRTRVKKRAIIINGAIRTKGNTDALVNKIIEGSSATDVEVNLVTLREKKVGNCMCCYQCLAKSSCSIQDDMTELCGFIQNAQLLIFASPLYWCGVTGLMKTFIDRLFFYYHPETKPLISGKKAIIITSMNQQNVVYESEPLVHFYTRLLNCLGIKDIDMFFFGEIMKKEDLSRKPQYLKAVYRIGKNLAKTIGKDNDALQTTRIHIVR
jgi:multimeric flavodoxin WrbA